MLFRSEAAYLVGATPIELKTDVDDMPPKPKPLSAGAERRAVERDILLNELSLQLEKVRDRMEEHEAESGAASVGAAAQESRDPTTLGDLTAVSMLNPYENTDGKKYAELGARTHEDLVSIIRNAQIASSHRVASGIREWILFVASRMLYWLVL